MGSKVIRNISKVLRSAANRIFGAGADGNPAELEPADVRTILSVSTTAEIAAAYQPIGSYAASSHTHTASQVTDFSEATDDRVAALLVAGTNISITYNDAANTLTIASTAGGLSGTGSVDNAALRADGTGGATLQNSALVINDNLTASPNNTVNHLCLEASGGTTNVSISIKPKGTGAFCLNAPDGTATGGNVRGANAVDLQTLRSAASQVASGTAAFVIGSGNTGSGNYSVTTGIGNTCSAAGFVHGAGNTVSGDWCVAFGQFMTVSGANYGSLGSGYNCTVSPGTNKNGFAFGVSISVTGSSGFGSGIGAISDRHCQRSHSGGLFAAIGDAQQSVFVLRRKTTDATPVTLMLDGSTTRLTIPSGKILFADVIISGIKSDGSAAACYKRKVAIKNVGGTTSLIGSVETIGTDIEDNALTDVTITADNTNDALQIDVTGITSEAWRWVAVVEGLEIAYGT